MPLYDDLFDLLKELDANGFANMKSPTSNPNYENWTVNSIHEKLVQDGQYSPEARQASERLSRYLSTCGEWTVREIEYRVYA